MRGHYLQKFLRNKNKLTMLFNSKNVYYLIGLIQDLDDICFIVFHVWCLILLNAFHVVKNEMWSIGTLCYFIGSKGNAIFGYILLKQWHHLLLWLFELEQVGNTNQKVTARLLVSGWPSDKKTVLGYWSNKVYHLLHCVFPPHHHQVQSPTSQKRGVTASGPHTVLQLFFIFLFFFI